MEIPLNRQLVPYYPEQRLVIPGVSKALPAVADSGNHSSKRNSLLLLPVFFGNEYRPDLHEPSYNSNSRLIASKINQVGLLIDIYA